MDRRKRRKRGTVLLEYLLTLFIAVLLIPISVSALRPLSRSLSFDEEVQDEIALAQMRRIILLAYDAEVQNGDLYITYQNDPMHFTFLNERIILQPGTQIFMSAIDDGWFDLKNGIIYVCYQRGSKTYEKAVGKP